MFQSLFLLDYVFDIQMMNLVMVMVVLVGFNPYFYWIMFLILTNLNPIPTTKQVEVSILIFTGLCF
ncbi:MAG: hypothetical protein ACRCZ2_06285 [Fusobacteriaceae bacterium]